MGLISRVSSRTYRNNIMNKLLIFATLTIIAFAEEAKQVTKNVKPAVPEIPNGVSTDTLAPAGISKINDINHSIEVALIGLSAVGLILTIVGLIYVFASIDPSKGNIVYKLSFQRLKTD